MAYYLTIKKNNKYIALNISQLKEFKKLSRYKNGGFSLEEIDNCTLSFCNEYFFKEALYTAGIIDIDDINKEISIRRKNKNTLEKVKYGLAFGSVKKYFDIYGLNFILLSKQNDKEFLDKLAAYYRNSYINNANISKLRDAINSGNIELLNLALRDFYMKEITKTDRATGELKINYKAFHDLATLIYNYDIALIKKNNGITIEEEKVERELTLECLRNNLLGKYKEAPCKNGKKKRVKSKDLEGQISIF